MSEEGEPEEHEEQEEYEFDYVPDDVIKALEDGPKSYLVGGVSKLQTVGEALQRVQSDHDRLLSWNKALVQSIVDEECTLKDKGRGWPALAHRKLVLVAEGEYDERLELTDNEAFRGLRIIGDAEPSKVVIKQGLTLGVCEATICGMSFNGAPGDGTAALRVQCQERHGVRADVVNCTFRGGRRVAEFHPWVEPCVTACRFIGTEGESSAEETGAVVYCHAQSRPQLRSGLSVLQQCPFRLAKADQKEPPSQEEKPSAQIPAGDVVYLDRHEVGGDEFKWSKVRWQDRDGYVPKQSLRYEAPTPCTITGTGEPGSVGLVVDDSLCEVRGVHITKCQTGCFLKEACKEGGNTHKRWRGCAQALLDGCLVENISGSGIYCTEGCRAAIRNCRVRKTGHYSLLVAASPAPSGKVAELCAQRESALLRGDLLLPESSSPRARLDEIANKFSADGVRIDNAQRFYDGVRYRKATREYTSREGAGTWPPPETRPLLRGNILLGPVKVQAGAHPSFFDNVVLQSDTAAGVCQEQESFAVTGIRYVAEEPKVRRVKRDDEEEEG
eukprot:TRINITY_DN71272_c0_g1_i1.p1 TRINITY_DN71272_c0_g1~~TRINITY_DN71272_c0_g1_i1.p1  ORF type:complete len:556 (+),score=194.41 TRINITY_DN71272_c0_g1_i1:88-1755(+)